jgi:hypothetical protein
MRRFIRHPIDVPIEVGADALTAPVALHAQNISEGGLALHSSVAAIPGEIVAIRIPWVRPPFETRARVAWCSPGEDDGYEIGVSFLSAEDAFRARMVEQLCHIEDYRRSTQMTDGRELSLEEAAAEWIAKFADRFPRLDGVDDE